jgi:hypothetical protein
MATAKEALEVEARMRDKFTTGLTRMGRGVTGFTKRATTQFRRLASRIFSVKGLLIGLGTGLVARSLARMVTQTVDLADSYAKLSDRLGESTEFLSELAFVAERGGVEFNVVAMGLQRLTRRAAQFRLTGGGPLIEAFDILGDEVRESVEAGESMEELLPKIARAMTEVNDQQAKVLAGMKLFDSEGVKNVQFLNESFEELMETAKRLGVTITDLQARRAAEFNDALTDLTWTLEGLKRTAVLELAPALTEMFGSMSEWLVDNRGDIVDFFRADLPNAISDFLGTAEDIEAFFKKIKAHYLEVKYLGVRFAGATSISKEKRDAYWAEAQGIAQELQDLLWKPGDPGSVIELQSRSAARKKGIPPMSERARQSLREMDDLIRQFQEEFNLDQGAAGAFVGPPAPERVSLPRTLEATEDAATGAATALRGVVERTKDFELMQDAVYGVAGAFSNTLGGALEGFIMQTEDAGKVFENFVDGILRDMARAGSQMISNALIGGLFRVVGGALGGLASGAVGGFTGAQELSGSALAGSRFETMTGSFMTEIGAASFQGGGLVRGSRPVPAVLHPPEAVVRTEQGAIPVEFSGRGGGGTYNIFNITAMDSRDVSRFFLEGAAANPEVISGHVAQRYQDYPEYRAQFG